MAYMTTTRGGDEERPLPSEQAAHAAHHDPATSEWTQPHLHTDPAYVYQDGGARPFDVVPPQPATSEVELRAALLDYEAWLVPAEWSMRREFAARRIDRFLAARAAGGA